MNRIKHLSGFGILLVFAFLCGCATEPESPQVESKEPSSGAAANTDNSETAAEQRKFQFTYGVQVVDVPEDAKVRIWIPIATSNAHQTVELVKSEPSGELAFHTDAKYGNRIGYCESTGLSEVAVNVEYEVTRSLAKIDDSATKLDAKQQELFLSANKLVPITGKPVELLADKQVPKDAMEAGQMLFDVVETHMAYDKSKPGYGKGDSVWACDSQTGNCTDFHSLFISLARNLKLPARFEIGFPIPANKEGKGKVGGYHCWAWFHIEGKGWVPVDISEADKNPDKKSTFFGQLPADRIAFSTGRDIELKPAPASEPLNYFVYPHVEVDGKVWPKEKIKLDFHFVDQP